MRIYTGMGDDGATALYGGSRVRKDDARVEAYGTVDELNASLGMARASLSVKTAALAPVLEGLQSELFDLGAELATPPDRAGSRLVTRLRKVSKAQIQAIEAMIDGYETDLEPLKSFILPGGSHCAAYLHLARTIARRAERRIITLASLAPVNPELTVYMNRLSDLLFVLARTANRLEHVQDVLWTAREE